MTLKTRGSVAATTWHQQTLASTQCHMIIWLNDTSV